MKLFSMDSPLMSFLEKLGHIMLLNWLMLICCIPIVTIGPAVTAVYWVTLKMVRNEEGGLVQDFFHSFRVNLKQGIVVGLIIVGIGTALGFELFWMYQIAQLGGTFDKIVFFFFVFLAAVFIMTVNYVWALLAKFNNTTRQLFRTARALAVRHLIATVVMGVISIVPIVMLMYTPASMAIAVLFYLWLGVPAIAYLQSVFMVKIFDMYLPAASDEAEDETASEVLSEE